MGLLLPPVAHLDASTELSSLDFLTLQRAYAVIILASIVVLAYDHIALFSKEVQLVHRRKFNFISVVFIASRYGALLYGLFVVAIWAHVRRNPMAACATGSGWSFGFTTVNALASIVMLLRVHALYLRSKRIFALLAALGIIFYGASYFADLYVEPVLLDMPLSEGGALHVCYLRPSSPMFAISFLAPSVFHHILLIIAVYRAVATYAKSPRKLVQVLVKDQAFFVLAICLVNFASCVLVFMPDDFRFKLANQLPSMVGTQVLLARLVFRMRKDADLLTPQISLPTIPQAANFQCAPRSPPTDIPMHRPLFPRRHTATGSVDKEEDMLEIRYQVDTPVSSVDLNRERRRSWLAPSTWHNSSDDLTSPTTPGRALGRQLTAAMDATPRPSPPRRTTRTSIASQISVDNVVFPTVL